MAELHVGRVCWIEAGLLAAAVQQPDSQLCVLPALPAGTPFCMTARSWPATCCVAARPPRATGTA